MASRTRPNLFAIRSLVPAALCLCAGFAAPVQAQSPPPPPRAVEAPDLPEGGAMDGLRMAPVWRFDREGDSEGWMASDGVAPLEVRGGTLSIHNVGADPRILGPVLWSSAPRYPFLALRCRSNVAGKTQIYYSKDEVGFIPEQMIEVLTLGDGAWHCYRIDLRTVRNWSGLIRRLRLDPVNGPAEIGATLEIDWIALYQDAVWCTPRLPYWKDEHTLVLGFDNPIDRDDVEPIDFYCAGRFVDQIACIESPGREEVQIDARALPAHFWAEARQGSTRIWRGRMVKPVLPATDAGSGAPALAIGTGVGLLARSEQQRVQLGPLASLTLRGPGNELTYYEFDPAPVPEPSAAAEATREYREYVEDPLLSDVLCTTRVSGTTLRTTLETARPVSVARFEGARMLEQRPHTHALFPGLEYLDAGEESSQATWTGPRAAERSTPSPFKITTGMMAFEYDRPQQPWVASLRWDPEPRGASGIESPAAEFSSHPDELSYATLFLPALPACVDENVRYAARPYPLAAGRPLELVERFELAPGNLEDVFAEDWIKGLPQPPGLDWAAPDERVPEAQRAGAGSREALERIVEISMLAYTQTLYSAAAHGWKTHIAIGEKHEPRRQIACAVLGESLRSARPEYAATVGLRPGEQIELRLGGANAFADEAARKAASDVLALMNQDGSVSYQPTPEMVKAIRDMTTRHAVPHADLGEIGTTESGLIAISILPLLQYAACSADPVFIAGAERALARMNSFTVPRGAQPWEIHIHTPDLYAAAQCALADLWGWRMSGDAHYLDEAERWLKTGLPFLYRWNPSPAQHVKAVDVLDQEGEGPVQALRDSGLFYADPKRQVAPFASLPAFGTSWYSVTWIGIPVQWCGLAWGNAVRELDALRPEPVLARIADGVFRSAANQQCDKSYLAGTLPDSWEISTCRSRQPYIIPERILEYAYRLLDAPRLESLQFLRFEGSRFTHAASRALLTPLEQGATQLSFDAHFFAGQQASVLVGGRGGERAEVRVNGRALGRGVRLGEQHWTEWDGTRGALLVRWMATGAKDRIEIDG